MAGKHVYCEKPLTLTSEGNQLIRDAGKKYNKVFQVGTLQRSNRSCSAGPSTRCRTGNWATSVK